MIEMRFVSECLPAHTAPPIGDMDQSEGGVVEEICWSDCGL